MFDKKVVILAGGVGGAKMVEGFDNILPKGNLSVIVNTGDDFNHYGLRICPDIDTVCYTLAGLSNPITGWGRKNESWEVFEQLSDLDGEDWFRLGDKDLATHLERTRRLRNGESLSGVINHFSEKWGISTKVFPMSDDSVATMVNTSEGLLSFQHYFVARKSEPQVKSFYFDGIEKAKPAEGIISTIQHADLIVIAPSNPWVSIDPILKIGNIRSEIQKKRVVAVSPIVGGKAIKGPAAKMFTEFGIEPSAFSVYKHYENILDYFVFDNIDEGLKDKISKPNIVTNTIMKEKIDKINLAKSIISFVFDN